MYELTFLHNNKCSNQRKLIYTKEIKEAMFHGFQQLGIIQCFLFSPLGMYSPKNVVETFQSQAETMMGEMEKWVAKERVIIRGKSLVDRLVSFQEEGNN